MTILKKLTTLAAVSLTAATIAAGSASAASPSAPKIESLPTAGVEKVSYGYHGYRCFGHRRVLPRRLVRLRLLRQGFHRIRGLYLRPGRIVWTAYGPRRTRAIYVTHASRRGFFPHLRYRLRVNACTGRVLSVRGPFSAYYRGY